MTLPKLNWGSWIMVALFVLGILYLLQVNALATRGYEIKKLEKRTLELKEANGRLELEATALKSIETIEKEAKILNFVPSGQVNYVEDSNFSYNQN